MMDTVRDKGENRDKFLDGVMEYTKKLGLTFDWDGCAKVWDEALEGEAVKSAVWYYLDTYEGISHDADKEFWAQKNTYKQI